MQLDDYPVDYDDFSYSIAANAVTTVFSTGRIMVRSIIKDVDYTADLSFIMTSAQLDAFMDEYMLYANTNRGSENLFFDISGEELSGEIIPNTIEITPSSNNYFSLTLQFHTTSRDWSVLEAVYDAINTAGGIDEYYATL